MEKKGCIDARDGVDRICRAEGRVMGITIQGSSTTIHNLMIADLLDHRPVIQAQVEQGPAPFWIPDRPTLAALLIRLS